jgi:fucose 4-O-acetylase-like acetyltransferase
MSIFARHVVVLVALASVHNPEAADPTAASCATKTWTTSGVGMVQKKAIVANGLTIEHLDDPKNRLQPLNASEEWTLLSKWLDHATNLVLGRAGWAMNKTNVDSVNRLVDSGNRQSSKGATAEHWRACFLWVLYAAAALAFELWQMAAQTSSSKPREGGWDVAKLWFMLNVVHTHSTTARVLVQGPRLYTANAQFMMPGFSLISGMFGASGMMFSAGDPKLTIRTSSYIYSFRDLILVQITAPLLIYCAGTVLTMIEQLGPPVEELKPPVYSWSAPHSARFLDFPSHGVWWYLVTLFIYRMASPIICLSKWPIIMSFVVPFLLSPSPEVRFVFMLFKLLPFYILGFVMGGGCLPAESRDDCRSWWNSLLGDSRVQLAAACYLLAWFALVNSADKSNEWIRLQFLVQRYPDNDLFLGMWQRGLGIITTMAFIAVSFFLARWRMLSDLGCRSLYAYILHPIFIEDAYFTEVLRWLNTRIEYDATKVAMNYLLAFIVTAVLTSSLTVRLTHAFVQPQWLLKLVLIESREESCVK